MACGLEASGKHVTLMRIQTVQYKDRFPGLKRGSLCKCQKKRVGETRADSADTVEIKGNAFRMRSQSDDLRGENHSLGRIEPSKLSHDLMNLQRR